MSTDLHRAKRATYRAWYVAHPDKASRVLHNLLLLQVPELRELLELFTAPPPQGRGPYNHHDGYRS